MEEALKFKFIQPSTSPAAASFFFVKNKGGGLHPCIDHRGLNYIKIKFPFLVPIVPAALEQMREAILYTNLKG